MDYNKLAEKWLRAETTLEEEKQLREMGHMASTAEERAIEAIVSHNNTQREERIAIRTRSSKPYWAVASAVGVCVIVLCFTLLMRNDDTLVNSMPEMKTYCYVNGEKITSHEQAVYYAQQVMGNIESEDFSQVDILGSLLTLE